MITFDNLAFVQDVLFPHKKLDKPPKYNAIINVEDHTFSVAYGGSCYGAGPLHDTYELMLIDRNTNEIIEMHEHGGVVGWLTADEITELMRQASVNETPTLTINEL